MEVSLFSKRKNIAKEATKGAIDIRPLIESTKLPLLITPGHLDYVELLPWVKKNRPMLISLLHRSGAILFRGFNIDDYDKFELIVKAISNAALLPYKFRSTPRREVSENVFSSTEYPKEQNIPLHNEQSYTSHWPELLFFCCIKPAEYRGYTPIVDSREVYKQMPLEVREEFERKGVRYFRTYGDFDLSRDEVFGCSEKKQIEAICKEYGIHYRWLADGTLSTWQDRPAVLEHSRTGKKIWFNQAHLFHVFSRGEEIASALIEEFGINLLPRHAIFADGTEISTSHLEVVRQVYDKLQVCFSWKAGDVLALENMLSGHGRTDYEGERKVIVAMTNLGKNNFSGE